MTAEVREEKSSDWKKFIRKHWNIFSIFLVAIILAFAGAIYVFLWFVKDAQSTSLVPSTLGMWSMANTVSFILHAIFWELVLIGIPVVIGAILGWQWWKRLSDEEKREYNLFGKGSRSRRAGGAAPPSFFIAFVIKVYVDGNWNMAISTYTLDYVVGSMVTLLVATAVIFGIPAIIGLILWLRHERDKNP